MRTCFLPSFEHLLLTLLLGLPPVKIVGLGEDKLPLDDNGNIMSLDKINAPINATWGEAVIRFHEAEASFPFHISTGEIFNNDPEALIRMKHLGLALITPLMTVIRSIYWLAASIFFALSEVYRYLDDGEISSNGCTKMTEAADDSLRAWKYGSLMTGCALAGLFAPFWARRRYALFERTLNRHSDGPHRDKFYTAICFQPLCKLRATDQLNDEDAAKKLNKYLDGVDRIQEAFWSFSWIELVKELG